VVLFHLFILDVIRMCGNVAENMPSPSWYSIKYFAKKGGGFLTLCSLVWYVNKFTLFSFKVLW
jgi:hypothetical protein